jgi:hypothetical protein
MKKILVFLIAILVFLVGCEPSEEGLPKYEGPDRDPIEQPVEEPVPSESPDDTVSKDNDGTGEEVDPEVGFSGITKEQCDDAYGRWNRCGSPCAGTDADLCIQMCQVQCECGGIAGFTCPEGFKCRLSGKIADEMGVCIKK